MDNVKKDGKTRIPAVAVIAAGAVVLAAAALALYIWWYPTTPLYSLSQASKALNKHDWNTFNRYVDVENLSMNLAKEITFIAYQKMNDKGIPSYVCKNLAVRYGTRVKKNLPGDIEAWVKNGAPPITSVLSPMLKGAASGKFRFKGISWNDGIAEAKVSAGKTGVLEIELIREQGVWRITSIKNVVELYEKSKGQS